MDKILIVARHEFSTNFKRREYIFFTFILPIILLLGAGFLGWLGQGENLGTLQVSQGQITSMHDYSEQILQGFTGQGSYTFIMPSIFAILFSMLIILSSIFLLQGIAEEKESRVIEVLLSSVSFTRLLIGKILGLGMLGLFQLIVWVCYAAAGLLLVFPSLGALIAAPVSVELMLFAFIYFALGYLLFASVLAAIGAISSSPREAQQIGNLFTVFAILPAWSAIFFANEPNGMLAKVLSYFPLTSAPTMVTRLYLAEISASEIAATVAILAVSIVIVIYIAAKLFAFGLLVYGKRPSIREMLSYLRKA